MHPAPFPPERADPRRVAAAELFAAAERVHPLDDGARLEYPGDEDTARRLLDFVLFERRRGTPLSYALRFDPVDPDRVALEIRGGARLGAEVRAWVAAR